MSEYNKELVEKVIKGMMKFRKFHHPKLSDDISRTLKSLENKGYIVREVDSDNRRNTLIKLSKKGNELVEKKKKDVEGYFERVFSHFTEEELQQYLNFQEKFYAAILEEGKTLKKEKEN